MPEFKLRKNVNLCIIYVQLQYIENGNKINLQIKKNLKKTLCASQRTASNGKRFLNKQTNIR